MSKDATAVQKLGWESIQYLDDKVPVAFNLELTEAIKDILNRPHLADKRKVKMEVELSPIQMEGGETDIHVVIRISPASRPARETQAHRVALKHNMPIAFFNADTPDRPRTGGLFDKEKMPADETTAARKLREGEVEE